MLGNCGGFVQTNFPQSERYPEYLFMNNIQYALVVLFVLAITSLTCLNVPTETAYALGVFTGLMAGLVATYMVLILCYRSMTFFMSLLGSISLCLYAAIMFSMGVVNPLIGAVDLSTYGIMIYFVIGFGCLIASLVVIANANSKYTEQSQVRE